MSDSNPVRLEDFERRVVLPSARFLPLFLCFIAILALIGAAIGLLYSFFPASKPEAQVEVAPVTITPTEVKEFLKRGPSQTAPPETSAAAPATPNASAVAIASELNNLRTQTTTLLLPWADQEETRCRDRVYGICLGAHRVLLARGVEGYIRQAFEPYEDNSAEPEVVTVSGNTYKVDTSQEQTKLAIIKELESVLQKATSTDAARVMQGWAELREEREAKRAEAVRAAEQEQKTKQREYEASIANKETARSWSLYSAFWALGMLMLVGLILAVLAIERHTRTLQGVMQPTIARTVAASSSKTPLL